MGSRGETVLGRAVLIVSFLMLAASTIFLTTKLLNKPRNYSEVAPSLLRSLQVGTRSDIERELGSWSTSNKQDAIPSKLLGALWSWGIEDTAEATPILAGFGKTLKEKGQHHATLSIAYLLAELKLYDTAAALLSGETLSPQAQALQAEIDIHGKTPIPWQSRASLLRELARPQAGSNSSYELDSQIARGLLGRIQPWDAGAKSTPQEAALRILELWDTNQAQTAVSLANDERVMLLPEPLRRDILLSQLEKLGPQQYRTVSSGIINNPRVSENLAVLKKMDEIEAAGRSPDDATAGSAASMWAKIDSGVSNTLEALVQSNGSDARVLTAQAEEQLDLTRDPRYFRLAAWQYTKLRDWSDLSELLKSQFIDPDDPWIRVYRGLSFEHSGDLDAALYQLDAPTYGLPGYVTLANSARIEYSRGRLDKALQYIQDAESRIGSFALGLESVAGTPYASIHADVLALEARILESSGQTTLANSTYARLRGLRPSRVEINKDSGINTKSNGLSPYHSELYFASDEAANTQE